MRLKTDDQGNAVFPQVSVTCRVKCESKATLFPSKALIGKLGYFLSGIFYEKLEFQRFTD